ncbi:MAG: hypothetical protein LBD64_05020 [Odoribacteraceae bacterium]|jgi:hypothetical protein|nr:hypothetical protein [Odoribacteraceae bacterium]
MFKAYDVDEALLDVFNRKQLEILYDPAVEAPHVVAGDGHQVPRHLIDFVSHYMHFIMRTFCYGDPEIGYTYLDMVTHGMAFTTSVHVESLRKRFHREQGKAIAELARIFDTDRVPSDIEGLAVLVHRAMMMISKLNFRVYGFEWKMASYGFPGKLHVKLWLVILSDEAESIRFVHNRKERVAFRVKLGPLVVIPTRGATVERSRLTGDPADKSTELDVYIQSHALQRVKERMDVFSAHKRNGYITETMAYSRRVIKGRSYMFECFIGVQTDDMDESVELVLGYLPFIVQDEKIFVLSFLPPVAPGTPDGDALERELGLQIEDMKYLGMDKLSFFLLVDIEQVPVLKEVIDRTRVARLASHLKYVADTDAPFDAKLTRMVKRFFDLRGEDVLPVM